MVYVTHGDERARIYHQGGIGFEHRIAGIGWVVNDQPSKLIARIALAARGAAFPTLEPIGLHHCTDEWADECTELSSPATRCECAACEGRRY